MKKKKMIMLSGMLAAAMILSVIPQNAMGYRTVEAKTVSRLAEASQELKPVVISAPGKERTLTPLITPMFTERTEKPINTNPSTFIPTHSVPPTDAYEGGIFGNRKFIYNKVTFGDLIGTCHNPLISGYEIDGYRMNYGHEYVMENDNQIRL